MQITRVLHIQNNASIARINGILFLTVALLLTGIVIPVSAQADDPTHTNTHLCLPSVTPLTGTDCSVDGPALFNNHLHHSGIVLPANPMPLIKPDYSLNFVNVSYAEVRTPNAPVYSSIDDAYNALKRTAIKKLSSSFSYVSYTNEEYVDGKRFYEVEYGGWMTANDVIRVSPPIFQGYEFTSTPEKPFGWILSYLSHTPQVETKMTPGFQNDDYTGHILNNRELVWVYESQEIDGYKWYMVGPDEWVHQHVIAIVYPQDTPPNGVDSNRWVEVNLHEQTISVYEKNKLVYATIIASGMDPFWTRPGLFQIYEKYATTPMRGAFEADLSDAYYLEDVPWTMYFDGARALHGAYWRANLGFPQSHGCVNLSVGDSRWLFDWAEIGDWVYVWDPSGETPVDPESYGEGGA